MTGLETSNAAIATSASLSSAAPEHAVATAKPPVDGGADAAAALVELSGVSPLTVENYEQSVPPNLATAAALASQLANRGGLSTAERSGVFALMNRSAVLALASD
jgi:hypothetical protein